MRGQPVHRLRSRQAPNGLTRSHSYLRVRSLRTEPLAILRSHRGGDWAVVFSADGRRVFSAGEDHCICVWFVAPDEIIAAARKLAFCPLTEVEQRRYDRFLR
jgi:hypothetical protein